MDIIKYYLILVKICIQSISFIQKDVSGLVFRQSNLLTDCTDCGCASNKDQGYPSLTLWTGSRRFFFPFSHIIVFPIDTMKFSLAIAALLSTASAFTTAPRPSRAVTYLNVARYVRRRTNEKQQNGMEESAFDEGGFGQTLYLTQLA